MKLNNISAVIFLILITIGSSIPGSNIPELYIFSSDKILHILEYSILGYLLVNILNDKTNYPGLVTIFLGFLFGIMDEIYQSTVLGRLPSSFDVIADVIGLTLSVILFKKFSAIMNR